MQTTLNHAVVINAAIPEEVAGIKRKELDKRKNSMTIITLNEAKELLNDAQTKLDLELLEAISERMRAVLSTGESFIALSELEYEKIMYSNTKLMTSFKSDFDVYHDSSGFWIKVSCDQ